MRGGAQPRKGPRAESARDLRGIREAPVGEEGGVRGDCRVCRQRQWYQNHHPNHRPAEDKEMGKVGDFFLKSPRS